MQWQSPGHDAVEVQYSHAGPTVRTRRPKDYPVPSDGGDASPEVDLGDLVTRQHRGDRCPAQKMTDRAAPAVAHICA